MEKILIKDVKAIVRCSSDDRVFYDTDILIEGNTIKNWKGLK
ncbi:hypothetical protein [endosymbiont 'TC1' of Trimyema compressum]|nr:hypothetical protein [endosymbiont 'TC1' of Trimyema compressum]